MQIEHLKYFLMVAKYGSISKAGKHLYVDQPNLSKIINALEGELGTKLFERSSRGVTLTDHGKQAAAWAKEVLEGQKALLEHFACDQQRQEAQLEGQLTAIVPINIAGDSFLDIVVEFSQRFPQISVSVGENSAKETIKAVAADPKAVGIVLYFGQAHDEKLTKDLLFIPLSQVVPVIYAAQNSRFAQQHKTTSFSAICKAPLVIYKPVIDAQSPVEEVLELYGEYNIKYAVSNLLTFYTILKKGEHITLGISRRDPLSAMEGLVGIPIRDNIRGEVSLVIARSAIHDPLVRAFVHFFLKSRNLPLPEALR